MEEIIITLSIIAVIIIIAFLIAIIGYSKIGKKSKKQIEEHAINKQQIQPKQEQQNIEYKIKQKYLSYTEQSFYNAIKSILNDKYIIFPQVPLSQIIIKNSNSKYQNELYRVIDFCIFDKNFHPLLCIEINDETHRQKNRWIRDKKVENLLDAVGMPLITLWTDFGVNEDYIERRIKQHIEL